MVYKASKFRSVDPLGPSCKKAMYNSRAEAEDMIKHIHENRVVGNLDTYQCNICGMWHLTSRSR